MDAPAGDVRSWSLAGVRTWLCTLGLGAYAPLFARHDITGVVLPDVTRPMLRAMGVEKVGDQLRLASAIEELRVQAVLQPPPPQLSQLTLDPAWDDTIEVLDQNHDVGHTRAPDAVPVSPGGGGASEPSDDAAAGMAHASRGFPLWPTNAPTGMSSRRLGARPPPLHLAQSSTSPVTSTHSYTHPYSHSHTLLRMGHYGTSTRSPSKAGLSPATGSLRHTALSPSALPSMSANLPTSSSASALDHATQPGQAAYAGHAPSSSVHLPLPQVYPTDSTGSAASVLTGNLPYDLPHTPTSAPDVAPGGSSESPDAGATGPGSGRATPLNRAGSLLASSNYLLRPRTHSTSNLNVSTPPPLSSSTTASTPTLEDLQRRTMKFVSADGASRMVTVSDCHDASEVMVRVLRKFGVSAQGNGYAIDSPISPASSFNPSVDGGGASKQVWRVAARMPEGRTRLLESDELLAICQGAPVHDRARGLLLVCLNPGPEPLSGPTTSVAVAPAPPASLDLERGPSNGGGEPTTNGASDRASPSMARTLSLSDEALGHRSASATPVFPSPPRQASREREKASMWSDRWESDDDQEEHGDTSDSSLLEPSLRVELSTSNGTSRRPRGMSKLEAFFGVRSDALDSSMNGKWEHSSSLSPEARTNGPAQQQKRRFVGQRPSSELISSHLADYFPATEKRVLQRSVRRSLHRSSLYQDRPLTPPGEKEEDSQAPTLSPSIPPSKGWANTVLAATRPSASPEGATAAGPKVIPTSPAGDGSRHRQVIDSSRRESAGSSTWTPRAEHEDSLRQQNPILPPLKQLDNISAARPLPLLPPPPWQTHQPMGSPLRMRKSGESLQSRPLSRRTSVQSAQSDTASLMTVDEITIEVESRRDQGVDTEFDALPSLRNGEDRRRSIRSSRSSRSVRSRRLRPKSSSVGLQPKSSITRMEEEVTTPSMPSAEEKDEPGTPTALAVQRLPIPSREEGVLEYEDDLYDDTSDDSSNDDLSDETGREQVGGKSQIRWIKGALIGAGSFGNVFLGLNQRTGNIMAVKQVELPPGYGALGQGQGYSSSAGDSESNGAHARRIGQLHALEREIELLKSLKHPNIVQYLDSYADATHLNIFLEYVPGGSVAALVSNYGRLNEHLARKFTRQILEGLKFLHSKAIVHRDIKGANVLVDTASTVKISDFGISKKVESVVAGGPPGQVHRGPQKSKHRASLQGSVFWMAPEMQALFKIGSGAAHPAIPESLSTLAKNFLEQTFAFDHIARPDAATLLDHPWLNPSALSSGQTHGATPPMPTVGMNAPSSGSAVTQTPNPASAAPAEQWPRLVRKKRPAPAIGSQPPT